MFSVVKKLSGKIDYIEDLAFDLVFIGYIVTEEISLLVSNAVSGEVVRLRGAARKAIWSWLQKGGLT